VDDEILLLLYVLLFTILILLVGLPPLVPHNPFANAEFAGIERVIPFMTN
jgi:hypothetical protein